MVSAGACPWRKQRSRVFCAATWLGSVVGRGRGRGRLRVRVGIRVRVRVLEAAGAGLGREPPCPGLLRLAEQREGRPGVPGQGWE